MNSNSYVLYKRTKANKIQRWSIEVEGGRFRTTEGLEGGALTTSEWTECVGKRSGASNATTPEQQAAKEVAAKVKKQKDKGYTEQVGEIDSAAKKIDPMLAHKWEDYADYALAAGGIATQPKLDGIRCIGTKDGLFTRNGKPILTAPHILAEVKAILSAFPGNVTLDGELYNHKLKEDFNKITSLVRKQNPNEEEIAEAAKLLQYHVYDLNVGSAGTSFVHRYNALFNHITKQKKYPHTYVVETHFIGGPIDLQKEALDQFYAAWLECGFEGQMIRISESVYQKGRTKDLLKRKEFEDGEFTIVDIEEGVGNRSGMMGRIKFEGFDSNARGTHEYFRELLANKNKYIGKTATVRFQNLTPDGKPRFPVMIAIRDYE